MRGFSASPNAMNPAELKRVVGLQQKKVRQTSRRFLVQGRKVVEELLSSPWQTETIYASEEVAEFVNPLATEKKVPVRIASLSELEKIGTFEKGNELVAIAVMQDQPKARAPRKDELILALDGITDPRNLGGLLRIADWFGVKQVVCSQDCMEVYNPKCVQSTMGSLFYVDVRYARLYDELTDLAEVGANLYFADMGGESVFDVALQAPSVLVLGSESHGLSEAVRSIEAGRVIAMPQVGRAESLNVAMAASALCAEFTRQRIVRNLG
jgi:TrmH family RNA methyltransferase